MILQQFDNVIRGKKINQILCAVTKNIIYQCLNLAISKAKTSRKLICIAVLLQKTTHEHKQYLINRKEPKRLLIFKSSNRILKSKHLKKNKQTYQRKMSKSLSGKFSKNYFHISPLFTRGKHHIIFSTTCGYFHVF